MEAGFFDLMQNYPKFLNLPFSTTKRIHSQAGPRSSLALWPIYPAFMAAVVAEHVNVANSNSNKMTIAGQLYGLISNDNSFLGGWNQRTLLTTFHQDGCQTNGSNSCLTGAYQVIQKPDLTIMTLLTRLPALRRVPLKISGAPTDARISGMASLSSTCVNVMLIRSDNTAPKEGDDLVLHVYFAEIFCAVRCFQMDAFKIRN